MKKDTKKWDIRLLSLAKHISTWSKDKSSKVGCVITDNRYRILGTGFNGLPYRLVNENNYLVDRELKLSTIIHAEENAILQSNCSLIDSYCFVYPLPVCSSCMSKLIQVGISRVVCINGYDCNKDWYRLGNIAKEMSISVGIEYITYDIKELE